MEIKAKILVLQLTVVIMFVDGDDAADDKNAKHSESEAKIVEGSMITMRMMDDFVALWQACFLTTMPGKSFLLDNVQSYVNYPARTTVGYAPKFTANRKFFGNLITSTSFKKMLDKDENELRTALIHKMKFCDESIMDQEILRDFYDREVDQSKLRRK